VHTGKKDVINLKREKKRVENTRGKIHTRSFTHTEGWETRTFAARAGSK
jgi:hypothetical protein